MYFNLLQLLRLRHLRLTQVVQHVIASHLYISRRDGIGDGVDHAGEQVRVHEGLAAGDDHHRRSLQIDLVDPSSLLVLLVRETCRDCFFSMQLQ